MKLRFRASPHPEGRALSSCKPVYVSSLMGTLEKHIYPIYIPCIHRDILSIHKSKVWYKEAEPQR